MPRYENFNVDDTVREEGNAVHWVIEQVHKHGKLAISLIGQKAYNGVFITDEMVEHASLFLDDIIGRGEVECDTSHGDGRTYEVRGRADYICYEPESATLTVADFKYGWSIVEPEDNWTLISHAIGWVSRNPLMPVHDVRIMIYQPRPHHHEGKVRTAVINGSQLSGHYAPTLRHTLSNPTDTLTTSEHCRNCAAMVGCPAAQKAAMNSVDVSEAAYSAAPDDAAMGYMLDQIDRAIKVLEQNKKAYTEQAMHRIRAGKIVPGYVVVKDLTNKQWKKGVTPELLEIMTGKNVSKRQLLTPAQSVKAGLDQQIVDALCERHEKGFKLARMDAEKAVKKLLNPTK